MVVKHTEHKTGVEQKDIYDMLLLHALQLKALISYYLESFAKNSK